MSRIEQLARVVSEGEAARAKLHQEIRKAYAEGTPPSIIAQHAGISRVRVHQIVGRRGA